MSTPRPISKDPSIREAAQTLGVSDSQVRNMCRDGQLAGYKSVGGWRISAASIEKFVKAAQKARAAAERRQSKALRELERGVTA